MQQRNNKKSNKRNKRRGNRRRGNQPQSLMLTNGRVPICRFPLRKFINLQYSIYAVYNNTSSTSFYSFNSSTSQSVPSFLQNIYADFITSTEYLAYVNQYAFMKIGGLELKISPSFLNSTAIVDAPSAFLNVTNLLSTSSITQGGVARSDNSIEIKLTNRDMDGQSVYFSFPGTYVGSQGTAQFGTDVWLTTRAATSDSLLYMALGSYAGPQFAVAANTVNRVAIIDVVFDVIFAAPVLNA